MTGTRAARLHSVRHLLASGHGNHHYSATVFIVVGAILILLGLGLIWMGTAGAEWANTHNKLLQPVPHYSPRQSAVNKWVGRIGGLLGVVLGIAMIVIR